MDASADAPIDCTTAVIELDHDAQHVSAETSRRLSCDAAIVRMTHSADGSVLDVGRQTRTIPSAIRRALAARDRMCRFPGCTSRRCDAHHIEHWVDGGATRLDNLVLLWVDTADFVDVQSVSPPPTWDGTPLDVAWAIDVLWRDAC